MERNDVTGFVYRVARKAHKCCECGVAIAAGERYLQDDHWAPFGNGPRYCIAHGSVRWQDRPSRRRRFEAQGSYGAGT